jgi:hypothetical protein
MTRRQRVLRWIAPYRALLMQANARNAVLRDAVAERDAKLSELRIDLAVEVARTRLANTHRDRARDLAGALMGEQAEFSAGDLAWLDDHEIGAE